MVKSKLPFYLVKVSTAEQGWKATTCLEEEWSGRCGSHLLATQNTLSKAFQGKGYHRKGICEAEGHAQTGSRRYSEKGEKTVYPRKLWEFDKGLLKPEQHLHFKKCYCSSDWMDGLRAEIGEAAREAIRQEMIMSQSRTERMTWGPRKAAQQSLTFMLWLKFYALLSFPFFAPSITTSTIIPDFLWHHFLITS